MNTQELQIDDLGYGFPVTAQKHDQSGDKNIERKALPSSQPSTHQENNMYNQTEDTTNAAPVPGVPSKQPSKAAQRAKNLGTVAMHAAGEYAAAPIVKGFFAGLGALATYKLSKKFGWL
jgi:hypothetical protein